MKLNCTMCKPMLCPISVLQTTQRLVPFYFLVNLPTQT